MYFELPLSKQKLTRSRACLMSCAVGTFRLAQSAAIAESASTEATKLEAGFRSRRLNSSSVGAVERAESGVVAAWVVVAVAGVVEVGVAIAKFET